MNNPHVIGSGTAIVAASPDEVFDFVLDLERYKRADHKIGRVGRIEANGDSGTVEFSGRILGLPGPRGVFPYRRSKHRLEFLSPIAGPARWFIDFHGTFDCEPTGHGTKVIHHEAYRFKGPWRYVAAPLRRWFERDTPKEMERFEEILGQASNERPS